MIKNLTAIACLAISAQISAITLSEYTDKLTQAHPFYAQLSLSEEASQINHQSAKSYSDWSAQLNVNDSYSPTTSLNSASYEVSTKKIIEETGGNLKLKHSWSDNSLTPATNLTSITYSQPLMENQGGVNDSLSADLAGIDLESKQLSLTEQSEAFLASKSKRFIDLALAQEKAETYRMNLAFSVQQLSIASEKYAQSLLTKSSLLQEQDSFVRAQQQSLQASQELSSVRQELSLLVAIDSKLMLAEFDLFQDQRVSSGDIARFVGNSRTIRQINYDRQKLKRQLISNENKLEPSLNLSVSLTSQGNSNSYFDSFANQDTSWQVGLSFMYPLGNTKELLDIRRTENLLAQLNFRQQEAELNLEQQIVSLLSRIDLLQELMGISLKQSQLANAKTLEIEAKYNDALSQKSSVIAAQKSANLTKLSYAQAAAGYQKAVIDYLSLTDQLVK